MCCKLTTFVLLPIAFAMEAKRNTENIERISEEKFNKRKEIKIYFYSLHIKPNNMYGGYEMEKSRKGS